MRTVSNIINNSIEANSSLIKIAIKTDGEDCLIRFKDNGKGIPRLIREDIFKRKFTHGKNKGSGLGLFQVNEFMAEMGGRIELESEMDVGTEISLRFVTSRRPTWFSSNIKISNDTRFVVLDDDNSIHTLWSDRIEKIQKNCIHFKDSESFESWLIIQNDVSNIIFLFDLELLGSQLNGIDLIIKYNLQKSSILVTSHYNELKVQNSCIEYGIKMIPKDSVTSIPFQFIDKKVSNSHILLDDDELVRTTWRIEAEKRDIPFKSYKSIDELRDDLPRISDEAFFYIDSNLQDIIKGEEFAKELYDLGKKEIYIVSGHDPQNFKNLSHIKAAMGKKPNFILN